MRIVLDTNVFIAAALKGGFSEDIIKMASNNMIVIICSEEILQELYKKLTEKFHWSIKDSTYFIDTLREVVEIVEIKEKLNVITQDPDDNKILECAKSGKANLVVSSDQDLIKLKQFEETAIVHPKTLHWIFPRYFKKK